MKDVIFYTAIGLLVIAALSEPKKYIKGKIERWRARKKDLEVKLDKLAAYEELEKIKNDVLTNPQKQLKLLIRKRGIFPFLNDLRQILLDSYLKRLADEDYRIYRKLYEDINTAFMNVGDRSYDKWARDKYLKDIKDSNNTEKEIRDEKSIT